MKARTWKAWAVVVGTEWALVCHTKDELEREVKMSYPFKLVEGERIARVLITEIKEAPRGK